MKSCHLDHEFDCTIDQFIEMYFDESFTTALFEQGLGWSTPHYDRFVEGEETIQRDMGAAPRLEFSRRVQKLLGDKLGYDEIGVYYRETKVFEFKHRTSIFGDRMPLWGDMRFTPIGDERCRRRSIVHMDCKILGVGRLLEAAAARNVHTSWDKAARWTNDWIRKNA